MSGVQEAPGHRGHALRRQLERGETVRPESVAHVEVHRVQPQLVLPGDVERVVELVLEDPELRRPVRARVQVRAPGPEAAPTRGFTRIPMFVSGARRP